MAGVIGDESWGNDSSVFLKCVGKYLFPCLKI